MNLKTNLAVAALLVGSTSMAQATSYDVSAVFNDGGVQQETTFNGTFDWDGSSVTNFSGFLSESMWTWSDAETAFQTGVPMPTEANPDPQPMTAGMMMLDNVDNSMTAMQGDAPLLNLTHQISSVTAGGLVTTSVFLQSDGSGNADTNVTHTDFAGGGGYDVSVPTAGGLAYGTFGGTTANQNAFFTLVFDAANPLNTTLALVDSMTYGDCTALGLMNPMMTGTTCMTGYTDGTTDLGSMGGGPLSLAISEVSAVPVPAAAWLFGGALMSLIGANRRKNVLPA